MATPAKAEDAKAAPAKAQDDKPAPAKAHEDVAASVAAPDASPAGDGTHANADSLLEMKLGDLLAAGMARDLQGAGRFIAQAISEIEKKPATAPAPSVTPRAAE